MSSQAAVIRDALLALLSPSMSGIVTTTKASVDTLEEADLPALCVVAARNRAERDSPGDLVGEPYLRNEANIVVTVRDKATTRDAIAAQLDAWIDTIKSVTLTASRNDAAPTTGATGLGAAFVDTNEGILSVEEAQEMSPKDGGFFFGNAHVLFVMQYHETWPPYVPDAFTTLGVTVLPADDLAAAVIPDVAVFTASIAGNVMIVSDVAVGALQPFLVISDTDGNVEPGTTITEIDPSAAGGPGVYTVNHSQTVASEEMTADQALTAEFTIAS